MRYAFALVLCPVMVNAGVAYDFSVQAVDQSNMAAVSPSGAAPAPIVDRYFAEHGKIRVGATGAKTVYLLEDGTVYVIDNVSRSVHVLKNATLSEVMAHYADAVKQLQEAAAAAPADDRAQALQKAAGLKAASERLLRPVLREYSMTMRFESTDGHACRIWEEREEGAKRLELCVAPTAAVPGGADLLDAMHTLSEFRQGGKRALGVNFGLSDWWPDVVHLGGVPLMIREYQYDSLIRVVTLTSIRPGMQSASLWDLPDGYRVDQEPDLSEW